MRRLLAAAAGGALLAAAFPAPAFPLAAWLAPAFLVWLAATAPSPWRATAEGFLFGLTCHGLTFAWWYGLLRTYGRLSHPEAAGVYILLAIYVALYGLAFALILQRAAARWGPAAALAAAPVAWAGLETIRGWLFTGLPWSVLGASQQPWPVFTQVADLGGVTAVSFVVACGAAALAGLALRRGSRVPAVSAALALAPLLALGYGAVRLASPWPGAGRITVGLVQGNVAQDRKWAASERMAILQEHLEATTRAAERGASLVVWPESSVPLAITSSQAYRMMLEARARSLGIDLLVGSVHYQGAPGERPVFNSAFLIPGRGGEELQRYDKIQLVPFGEYVPLRSWLTPVEKIVEEASDFSRGEQTVVFTTGGARVGPFICFEAVFPGLVRRFAAGGAELLVNLTNDAMLGEGAGPSQHLALAALRAVENRRWMVRAANTGISAVIDPAGRVVESIPCGTAGEIVRDVPLMDKGTLFTAAGQWLGWGCVTLTALLLVSTLFPGRIHQ